MVTFLAIIVGLILAAIGFILADGGLVGLSVGLMLAILSYLAIIFLVSPDRKLDGIPIEFLPDGQKAADAIDHAKTTLAQIERIQVNDRMIFQEILEFSQGFTSLIRYVENNPSAYDTLRHYDNTYGKQAISLLTTYADVERSGSQEQTLTAKNTTVKAMDAMETAAKGELDRAVGAQTLKLQADSQAVSQLTAMDGYSMEKESK